MTEELIRASAAHDRNAGARALIDTYYSYVYAIVYRRLCGIGTHEDAEECVSDVFLDVLGSLPAVREGSLQAYIGTVARNKAINACRALTAAKRRTASLDEEGLPEPQSLEDIAAGAERAEQTRLLLDAIEQLGEPDATIIIQKYYYDRNASEIGRILGMNPITVRSRCARALKKLRTLAADIR